MKKTSLIDEITRFSKHAQHFSSNTPVYEYIQWLNEYIETKDPLFTERYLPIVQETECNAPSNRPFLTVITRTQGKRPEMLRETLLCLSAQTDMDFEVLLIGHMPTDGQQALIDSILNEQTPAFREKIRYIKLDYGTRTTPLNIGFSHAYGEYVAILDDDDIIFDNWVEEFHKAAMEAFGKIIHSYAVSQNWSLVDTYEYSALRAEETFSAFYCQDYQILKQIEYNTCPLMSLAFPTVYFKKMGMIFDESLTTTEDWDYFMRLSFLTGVKDVQTPTAIYRFWNNSESSATIHDDSEWKHNYSIIQDKFNNMPILLPIGQEKQHLVTNNVYVPVERSLRIYLKQRIQKYVPSFIWKICKKMYRALGGKKWLG